MNMDERATQLEFGLLVGVSRPTVSEMVRTGVLLRGGTFREWNLAYCANLREQAAGRMGKQAGGLSLADERAALSRAQRLAVEHKNAVTRGEYARIGLIADVLGAASAAVRDRMDHIEGHLAKRCPALPEDAKRVVLAAVAEARNAWADACVQGAKEYLHRNTEVIDDDAPDEPPARGQRKR